MIAQTVQRGEYLAIEGARHLPNVEDPGPFNRIAPSRRPQWRRTNSKPILLRSPLVLQGEAMECTICNSRHVEHWRNAAS
jgi:hypothetical protein